MHHIDTAGGLRQEAQLSLGWADHAIHIRKPASDFRSRKAISQREYSDAVVSKATMSLLTALPESPHPTVPSSTSYDLCRPLMTCGLATIHVLQTTTDKRYIKPKIAHTRSYKTKS